MQSLRKFIGFRRSGVLQMKQLVFGLAVTALMLGMLSQPSKAQQPETFQGLFGGFFSGYVGAVDDYRDTAFGPGDMDLDGWINGLTAGYNHKFDRILVGVEVDGSLLEAHDRQTCPAGGTCETDLNWLGMVRGRVGYIFGDEQLYALYFTGGFAIVGVNINNSLALTGPKHFSETGYVIGGGGEAYLFDTNWISTKVEYLYVDFGESETFFTGSVTTGTLDLSMHIVRVGLNIHF